MIDRNKYKSWSKDELDYILNNYRKKSIRIISEHLGRTEGSVNNKLYQLRQRQKAVIERNRKPINRESISTINICTLSIYKTVKYLYLEKKLSIREISFLFNISKTKINEILNGNIPIDSIIFSIYNTCMGYYQNFKYQIDLFFKNLNL